MNRPFAVACTGLAFVGAACNATAAEDEAARVIVVANASDHDSLALASFYAGQRHIPDANIIALPMPVDETVTWEVFARDIYRPLQAALVEQHWIHGTMGQIRPEDPVRVAVSGHRMSYLVVCRGVPLRIALDAALLATEDTTALPATLRTNQAAVDGELALLAARNDLRRLAGPVRNPLFDSPLPGAGVAPGIVRVSRIDGPSTGACERMILSALRAEERGLAGRAYVDLGGPHALGDEWLQAVAGALREQDFEVVEQTDAALFPVTARFDAPAWYFGWYGGDLAGPFTLPGFRFPSGAIALHIHSFSARTLHDATQGWTGPFVELGAAATVGNVFEPLLGYTHHPALLVAALLAGHTWGESAYHALPVLSWQAVTVGDPLYRPFARSLAEQMAARDGRADPGAQYVVQRQAHQLMRNGRRADALALLAHGARETPGLALSLQLAQLRHADGDREEAVRALAPFKFVRQLRPDEIGVAAEAAQLLVALGEAREAVEVYRLLLAPALAPPVWRVVLLPRARDAAAAAGQANLQRQWADEAARLP